GLGKLPMPHRSAPRQNECIVLHTRRATMNFRLAISALGAAALAASTLTAQAADVVKPVIIVPPGNPFDGFYIGGHIGGGRADRDGCAEIFSSKYPGCQDPFETDFKYHQDGGIVGGQVGLNYTFPGWDAGHSWLIGGEVSADLTGMTGNLGDQFPGYSGTGDWNWLALAVGKLGFTWDNWLFYGDVGLGMAGFTFNAGACNFTSNNQGWAGGRGVGWASSHNNNWFVDWQHLDLDRKDANCGDAPVPFNGFDTAVSTKPKIDIFRVGFNHQFE